MSAAAVLDVAYTLLADRFGFDVLDDALRSTPETETSRRSRRRLQAVMAAGGEIG